MNVMVSESLDQRGDGGGVGRDGEIKNTVGVQFVVNTGRVDGEEG